LTQHPLRNNLSRGFSAKKSEVPAKGSKIVANFITILHECKDFSVWKKSYDADVPRRSKAGLTQLHVLRDLVNPQLLALMFEVSDLGRAKAMASSPDLAAAMKAGGIIGVPRVKFRHGSYTHAEAATYASMTLTVRDFETAKKAYAMDAVERKGATLTDLGILQADDDPNNLLLVWAVGDVARAKAFFDSPKLAAHMSKNAGVVGAPEQHFLRA
jgi:hypothetical protein